MNTAYKILVVDDEEDLCEILKFNIELEGFSVDTAYSAEEALLLDLSQYDLLMLDVMMGEISGYQMAQRVRSNPQYEKIPIVFLTAKDTENDMLHGFNVGADDYISKPYSIREVIVRIKALLRRTSSKQTNSRNIIGYKTLSMDISKKKTVIDGVEVQLTKKEFEILKLLLNNLGQVFSREEMLSRIWTDEVYVLDRTIDVNITRLRKKIGPYGKNIITRLGYGYCFEPDTHA
ncbi:MAG: response regulator transcription factor [Bacteroidales bacterium]